MFVSGPLYTQHQTLPKPAALRSWDANRLIHVIKSVKGMVGYSITREARATTNGAICIPSAFAVFTLTTSSYFVGS